jgi:hypothetical protein
LTLAACRPQAGRERTNERIACDVADSRRKVCAAIAIEENAEIALS